MTSFRIFAAIFCLFTFHALGAKRLAYMVETGESKHIALQEDGKEAKLLTSGNLWHLYPDLDGSGSSIVYVEIDPTAEPLRSRILLQDIPAKTTRELAGGIGQYLHPDLSGDGRTLAYTAPLGPDGRMQIAVRKTADEADTLIIETDAPAYFPALASDGSFLVFQLNTDKDTKHVVRYDFEEKKFERLTEQTGVAMAPALSFDDRRVVFTEKHDEVWNIFTMDLTTKKKTQVTDSPSHDFAPNFTPEGNIIFASDRGGHFELYSITATELEAGTNSAKALVTGEASYYAPVVSGDLRYQQSKNAPVPNPARSSFGSAVVGNRIYIAGGHQGNEHTYPPESFLAHLEYFDLSTGEWHRVAPRKNPCHGFEIIAHGKYLYAFGGFAYSTDHKPAWKSLDTVERYDTETDEWVEVGKLPRPRSSNIVAVVDDKAYLIGGWDSTPKSAGDLEGRFHREIDVFDLKTETASTLEYGIPDPLRRAFSAEVLGDEILLIGGIGQGASHFDLLDHVTAFNPKTGKWRELAKLPFATFAPAAGILDGELFVFGGMFKTGPLSYVYVNHAYRLDGSTGKWAHTGRHLAEPKGFAQVVSISEKEVGILGGHSYEGGDAPVATFETFKIP
ncbi:MAG: PD40 domain-containing protein [Bdellovibrionales bacterium]|nr:PD40 domain-containing protein [Bdellovibrionales bacterium]